MSLQYRVENSSLATLENDLKQWLKEGYELVSHNDAYVCILVYRGGARPHGAVRNSR